MFARAAVVFVHVDQGRGKTSFPLPWSLAHLVQKRDAYPVREVCILAGKTGGEAVGTRFIASASASSLSERWAGADAMNRVPTFIRKEREPVREGVR